MTATKDCATCGGDGWQWLLNSMFIFDGYRKEKCGICDGTGKSRYPGVPEFVKRQRYLREQMVRQCA